MPGWISPWEIILLVFILLLIFGPKRLPGLGRSLGEGMRDFKDGITGKDKDTAAAEGQQPALEAPRQADPPKEASPAGAEVQPADGPDESPASRDAAA